MDSSLKHLTDIGLTEYEARVYQYLLHQSPVAASDLSKHTGIPAGRVYGVLDSLVRKGFGVVVPGKRKSFAPVKPTVAIDRIVEGRRQREAEWEQLATRATELLESQFAASTDLSSAWDFLRVYTTPESMTTKFWELCFASAKEIRAINKSPYVMAVNSQRARPNRDLENLDRLMHRGIVIRTLIEEEPDRIEDTLQLAGRCAANGQPVRIGRQLPLKLHVFDDTAAMITLAVRPASNQQTYSLLVEHRTFCEAMIQLHEMHWHNAVPFAQYVASQPAAPGPVAMVARQGESAR